MNSLIGSILTIFDLTQNWDETICFILDIAAIGWNLVILGNILRYFEQENRFFINIEGFDILMNMNLYQCDILEIATMILEVNCKILTILKTMILHHILSFLVYIIKNEILTVFLIETDFNCIVFYNVIFEILLSF